MERSRLSRRCVQQYLGSIVFLASIWVGPTASAMTVEEAYRAIPHRYTPFNPRTVRMNPRDAVFLEDFFRLVNSVIVERVRVQASLQSEREEGSAFPQYQRAIEALLARMESQAVPEGLKSAHRGVIDAIKDQRAYFADWRRALSRKEPFKSTSAAHPKVASSSSKLHEAYAMLMQAYPQESDQTKQAFFDHLCALDLI